MEKQLFWVQLPVLCISSNHLHVRKYVIFVQEDQLNQNSVMMIIMWWFSSQLKTVLYRLECYVRIMDI